MSTREKVGWGIGGLIIIIYCLFPVAWIVSLSFKSSDDIANGQFLPTAFSGANYEQILVGDAAGLFLPALVNSFGICLIATFISCLLSMFAAYAIARLDFPGKKIILSTALAVAIFPVISIVTPLFNLWRQIVAAEMAPVGSSNWEAPVKNARAAGTGRARLVEVSEMP